MSRFLDHLAYIGGRVAEIASLRCRIDVVARPPSSCVSVRLLVVTGMFFSPLLVPRLRGGVWIETG
jgi:hypothetical protein